MNDGGVTAPLFLGVDGGGSKTLAVLVDGHGEERGRGLAGSSNYQAVGLELAVAAIRVAVATATAHDAVVPTSRVAAAWIGLAGVDRPHDIALLTPTLATLAGELRVTNDAELALSGLERGVGIALIAGTGAIVVGRDAAGETTRASGWGHLLGDEGSGYDIGLRALRAVARAADGRGQPTALSDRILTTWGLSAPEDLFTSVYADQDKARIARLANHVIAASRDCDAVAQRIVQDAAEELALAVRTVATRLDLRSPLDLALGGGLLIHEPYYRDLIVNRIRRDLELGDIQLVEEPALQAARRLAVEHQQGCPWSERKQSAGH